MSTRINTLIFFFSFLLWEYAYSQSYLDLDYISFEGIIAEGINKKKAPFRIERASENVEVVSLVLGNKKIRKSWQVTHINKSKLIISKSQKMPGCHYFDSAISTDNKIIRVKNCMQGNKIIFQNVQFIERIDSITYNFRIYSLVDISLGLEQIKNKELSDPETDLKYYKVTILKAVDKGDRIYFESETKFGNSQQGKQEKYDVLKKHNSFLITIELLNNEINF